MQQCTSRNLVDRGRLSKQPALYGGPCCSVTRTSLQMHACAKATVTERTQEAPELKQDASRLGRKRSDRLVAATRILPRQAKGVSNINRFYWTRKAAEVAVSEDARGGLKGRKPLPAKGSSTSSTAPAALPAELSAPADGPGNKTLPFLPLQDLPFSGAHKPVGLIAVSAHILGTACQLSEVVMNPVWMPCALGGLLGILFAGLNRFGMRRVWRSPQAPLNVVITGGSRGLGKALAREFLRAGDRVVFSARSAVGLRKAAAELRAEVDPGIWVMGVDCNVSSPGNVDRLADAAQSALGHIDVWINNAGCSGSFQAFTDATPERLQEVVSTNLVGSLLCTRRAMQLMSGQGARGHIFNMDGAGADGQATPHYAGYGATKAGMPKHLSQAGVHGIAHLMGSLSAEAGDKGLPVSIHTLSPGMVLTGLLLDGASNLNKAVFNILCEQPETVAAFLVPRVRTTVARGASASYIRFLTGPRAIARLLLAPIRIHRFFDGEGNAKYEGEHERIMGQRRRRATARLQDRAARRSKTLGLAYSSTMAVSYLLLMMHALQQPLST